MDIKRLQQVASNYCRYIRNGDERAINSILGKTQKLAWSCTKRIFSNVKKTIK